jgi:hypothetical protein
MRFRNLHLVLALAVLVLSGVVHGMWTNRWSVPGEADGKNLLAGISQDVGDWKPGDFQKINPAEIPPNTRCDSREFTWLKNGKRATVSITSGSPAAVAVHTPDVCFLGAGWKLRGPVVRQSVALPGGVTGSFWVGDFTKTTATSTDSVRVRWSWSADGNWVAPDYPRWVLARAPILYKLYVVHSLAEEEDLTHADPYRKFVADLLPALSRQMR